jgi:hypothetical protein
VPQELPQKPRSKMGSAAREKEKRHRVAQGVEWLLNAPPNPNRRTDFMSFSFFTTLGHKIAGWFGSHQTVIQTVITDAKLATATLGTVAAAAGEGALVAPIVSQITDGLTKVGAAVAIEATAATLTQHAATVSALAESLLPDLGVKNEKTIAAIGTVLTKTQGVVGALETAANAIPAVPTPAPAG